MTFPVDKNIVNVKSSDGLSLKKKLSKALFRSRLRAFGLVTPLLDLARLCFSTSFPHPGKYNDTFENI